MLKLIVFDWDGTLADSVAKIVSCKKFLAFKYGFQPPSEEMVKSVLGIKFEEAIAKCFPAANEKALKLLSAEFHFLMKEEQYQATLFPMAKEVLNALKQRGFKLAIATSKDKGEMAKAIQYCGLEKIFDIICCGKEYGEKPNSAMLVHIMNTLKAREDECIMIGDTITDMEFAKAANVKAIAVTFGAHSQEKLKPYKPVAFLSDWRQLTGVIDKLCSMKASCRL